MLMRLGLNPSPLGLGLRLGLILLYEDILVKEPPLSSTTMGLGFGL